MSEEVLQILINKIVPNPDNRRVGGFDPVKLHQLADSIKEVGVQQPVIVRLSPEWTKDSDGPIYELVAGERRCRASELAGLVQVPAIVRELTDLQVLKVQTIENLQREDVHPLDEADGFARLIDKAGYEVEQIAQELGKSASYVYQRLKLRDLVPGARAFFVADKITAGHAILIARLAPKQQEEVLKNGLMPRYYGDEDRVVSVRDLDHWIHDYIFMELSKASWKLDDEQLLPAAGSCKLCLKRTGFQPSLFADVCKKDCCTDRACFSKKQAALLNQRREQLKDVPHIEVEKGWNHGGTPKGAFRSYDWQECKKDEKGAKRVLVVAGEGVGRFTYGKVRENVRSHGYQPSPKELAEREKEKKKQELNEAFRRVVYDKTIEAAAEHATIDTELLRMIVARSFEAGFEEGEAVARLEGWPENDDGTARLKAMDRKGLLVMLVKLAIANDVEIVWSGDRLLDAAKICGVDLKAARKDAAAKLKAKKEPKAGTCRVCSCTDDHACPGGCSWVDESHTLCSSCKGKKPAGKKKDSDYLDMLEEASEA